MTAKKPSPPERFDLVVVGAGHAGCEAAMAASGLGLLTLLLTINADRIGHLSCNPAIGGLAKGHMVREIDALGGMMGLWADESGIQFRTLNTRKGPAVRATRAQIDRDAYLRVVRRDVFSRDTLWVRQDMAEDVLTDDGRVCGVRTQLGQVFAARAVCLTTGTFLRGLMHVGLTHFPGAGWAIRPPRGFRPVSRVWGCPGAAQDRHHAAAFARQRGLRKNHAPAGDDPPPGFSFHGPGPVLPQVPCHLTYTNEAAHAAIREGFDRSPLFTGVIQGTGARYCPSIEDKVARFPEKERHQIFIEPEGLESPEVYPNGIPTACPWTSKKGCWRPSRAWRRPRSCVRATPSNTISCFPPS
jgi:tRNA uridine 5-carboxymethylaminomethyl modification enzyme